MSVNVSAAFTDPVSYMEQQPSFRQLLHMSISCRDAWRELCEQWYGPTAWILHHKHTSEAVMVKDVQWKFRAGLSVALCVRWAFPVSLFPTYKSQSHETVLWLTQRLHHSPDSLQKTAEFMKSGVWWTNWWCYRWIMQHGSSYLLQPVCF